MSSSPVTVFEAISAYFLEVNSNGCNIRLTMLSLLLPVGANLPRRTGSRPSYMHPLPPLLKELPPRVKT